MNLDRIGEKLLYHPLLGLDRDPMGDLNQELDQAVDDFAFAGNTIEGQQRQADLVGVTSQFPGGLDRRAPAKLFGKISVNTAQQICRQRERADEVEFGDFGHETLQTDPSRIACEPGERRAIAIVGEQSVKTPTGLGIEATLD